TPLPSIREREDARGPGQPALWRGSRAPLGIRHIHQRVAAGWWVDAAGGRFYHWAAYRATWRERMGPDRQDARSLPRVSRRDFMGLAVGSAGLALGCSGAAAPKTGSTAVPGAAALSAAAVAPTARPLDRVRFV